MFKNPLPLRYRIVTEGTGECLLCSEPEAPLRVWEAIYGPVPDGFVLGHRGPFMVPSCVNPDHLLLRNVKWPGTQEVRHGGCQPDPKAKKVKKIAVEVKREPKIDEQQIDWKGELVWLAEVAKQHDVDRGTLLRRLRAGWEPLRAATKPKGDWGKSSK